MKPISQVLNKIKSDSTSANKTSNGINGILSGFSKLDKITCGFKNSDLILIASPKQMGRFPFLLSIAYKSSIKFQNKVGIISSDMSASRIIECLIQSELGIPLKDIDITKLNDNHKRVIKQIENADIIIDDDPNFGILEILERCNKMKYDFNTNVIIINYLQLIKIFPFENNADLFVNLVRILKIHAKALNIPIILASDLPLERKTDNFYPELNDLKAYGEIEQYVDQVVFLFRPECFGIKKDEAGNSTNMNNWIIVAKNRNGNIGELLTSYDSLIPRFKEAQ